MKNFKLIILVLFLISCSEKRERNELLSADREAPIGWIYLKIYDDNSFEFISRGLRDEEIFDGTYKIENDTIIFTYKGKIPVAGSKAIITENYVNFINGKYPESVKIKLNKLKK